MKRFVSKRVLAAAIFFGNNATMRIPQSAHHTNHTRPGMKSEQTSRCPVIVRIPIGTPKTC